MKEKTIDNLMKRIQCTDYKVFGNKQYSFSEVSSIENYKKGTLSFCLKSKRQCLKDINGGLILTDYSTEIDNHNTYIIMDNVRLNFNRVVRELYGNGTYPNIDIGSQCDIHQSVIIGKNGFGFIKNERGEYEQSIHIGGVKIEDRVSIGANTTVDRGTIDDTVIGEGTKIDNHCHIGHNAKIGKNCIITAHVMIGNSYIGDDSWIAPTACILPGKNIGKNVIVGMGAVVIDDVPDGMVVVGNPAFISRENEEVFKEDKKRWI